MFLSVWHAEHLKLRHSPMWIAFFLLPLIPAFFWNRELYGKCNDFERPLVFSLDTAYPVFVLFLFAAGHRRLLCLPMAA